MLLTAGTLITGAELLRPGWIDVSGDRVTAVGAGAPPRRADRDLGQVTVVPGFVDTHTHGGGGGNFSAASAADTSAAVGLHRRHGTTTMIASLVTAGPDELLRQVSGLAEQVGAGLIDGIHLEGPWLSTVRCGAHQPALMRDPDPAEINRVLTAAAGTIRMVTIAPERPGALAAIRRFVDAGVVVAVGHTEATYEQTRAAIAAGAAVGTHLFNAMRPIDRREPGPVIALIEDPAVTVELITDGVHIDAAIYRHVTRAAGRDRVSLITDAMAATGMPDGRYHLGPVQVDVADGVALVGGTDTVAGSTATMDQVVRFAVAHCGLTRDEALMLVVRQASLNPARALGLPGGGLTRGAAADLVVLGPDLTVAGVLRRGAWELEPAQ
ncbi:MULTISPECIES: N-acetylglucosamine-6-phosphate deacetylase [unclassified Mycolicibacterium]|uniref:N-acetylglucosamine-6-phosphate deacetylase n=1 Tax=unclassified Mycolicibacterium TaxID=2636767 RepID=UPI00130640FA|nr:MULTISPECIES: N-acetylglucosamine-6-phosphate deacetylase [unclassified Mycolicibacterium]MUL80841.1 N-acetylglucosamine-6-phosphate deacetylase [Mycolicibacterium sp. CBMA 329]MUL86607.1 N-acetylglucosamine-6-phosphate deacetylase [Mycolicibacterium sp. CBMA 331]MUM02812.1 N-acetylglucosamine-6-phosphate deacetylase [Mycolicibacterium sp. CBMA 334]MUM26304.1 N-acetylglucosamine-6-phosphate deacetylase [Mycolicibacterium sp. CBMA 295]MUM36904.1 N-acetylglucosamine-6-phosphate deacetylase [M